MGYKPTIGIGQRSLDLVTSATQVVNNEIPIDFDSGNYATRELTRFQPITEILFYLTGGITIGTADATALKPGGALNLIQELAVVLNNDYYLMKVPGKFLRILSQWYDKQKRTATDPGLTVGNHPIAHGFRFPLDVGGFWSCLDASAANSLMAQCLWGTPEQVLTPAGTTTLAVDAGTKLKIQTKTLSGYEPGLPGGVNYGYTRHLWNFNNHAIPSIGENRFVLNKSRLYSGMALFVTDAAGNPADGIITKLKLQIGTTVIKTWDMDMLRDDNIVDLQMQSASDMTGVYLINWGDDEHLEQMQAIAGGQDMEIVYEASAVGNINFVHDYFILPRTV